MNIYKLVYHATKPIMKPSQKVIIKCLSTVGFSMGSALATHHVCKEIHKHERPLSSYEDKKKREKVATKRVARDSAIGVGFSLISFAGRNYVNDMIDRS